MVETNTLNKTEKKHETTSSDPPKDSMPEGAKQEDVRPVVGYDRLGEGKLFYTNNIEDATKKIGR